MSDSIILTLGVGVLCFAILHAFLMLFSPEKHRRFNFWLTTLGGRLNLEPDEQQLRQGFNLSYRAVGLFLLCVCIGFMWAAVSKLKQVWGQATPTTPTQLPPPHDVGANWLPFALGLAAIATGVYFIRKPEAAYRWSMRGSKVRGDMPPDRRRIRIGMGLFGLCFVGFGLLALAMGVYRFARGGH